MSVIKRLKQALKRIYCGLVWSATRTSENRLVFISFSGGSYSDNPKAISEKIHELDSGMEIIWINNGTSLKSAPDYVRQVTMRNRWEYYKALASAKVIINNFSFQDIPKKKDQMYIQTWHGDRGFKKILHDSPFVASGFFTPESKAGFCDIAVAGSDFGEKVYQSAFHYHGEVMKEGTPRNDALLHVTDSLIHEKKAEIGLNNATKYLLYAPTFRRAHQHSDVKQTIQSVDIKATLTALENQYGGTWECLLRAHPSMSGLTGNEVNEQYVTDVSKYPDMADLLMVADVLITDYSSSAGDYALLKRPVFLFQSDIDEYLKNDRTFYFEMSDSPYLITHSQDELNSLIASVTLEMAADNCDKILTFYGTHETGHAALAVAKRIIEFCKK